MLIGVTLTFPVTFLLTFAVGYAIWGDSELAVSLVLSAVRTVHGVWPHVLLGNGAEVGLAGLAVPTAVVPTSRARVRREVSRSSGSNGFRSRCQAA